jgi:hypothetical protein
VCTKREINENVILVKWQLATWTADVCASPNSRKEESLSQDFAMSVCHVAACVCVCVCNPVIIIIKIIIEGCDDDIIKWNLLACF